MENATLLNKIANFNSRAKIEFLLNAKIPRRSAQLADSCDQFSVRRGLGTFLIPFSYTGEFANLARPLLQFLNPPICSAISFDSGTNSVRAWALMDQASRS